MSKCQLVFNWHQKDLRDESGGGVSYLEASKLAKTEKLLKYFEVSALTGENVKQTFEEAVSIHFSKQTQAEYPVSDSSCFKTIRTRSVRLDSLTISELVKHGESNTDEVKSVIRIVGKRFEEPSEESLKDIKVTKCFVVIK